MRDKMHLERRVLEVSYSLKSYEIHIGYGFISHAFLLSIIGDKPLDDCVFFVDENVLELYPELFKDFQIIEVPSGELSKSIGNYSKALSTLCEFGISRSGLIIAIGGGVVGDLAGFIAATYMRGINYIQVPTTLLAIVDSSVGGKVAVNLKEGKNLAGAFHQPKCVYIDLRFLTTLPSRELSSGMAEVIKYAFGFDKFLLEGLIENESIFSMADGIKKERIASIELLMDIVHRCLAIKSNLVAEDQFDQGNRQLLNFGHTLGHAIESYYGYERFTHGEAVAIGIVAKLKIAYEEGILSKQTLKRYIDFIETQKLPISLGESSSEVLTDILVQIKLDKKADHNTITWVALKDIGALELRKEPFETIKQKFMEALDGNGKV